MIEPFGISEDYDYYELSLDSADFSRAYNPNVTALNHPVFFIGGMKTLTNIVAVKVISAEIPFSYYIVTAENNTFILNEDGGGDLSVTITPGNYTSSTMITELNTKLTAAGGLGATYTTTYSSTTNKFTITGSGGTLTDFTLTFGSSGSQTNTDLHWFLGFVSGVNASTLFVLEAPNVLLLSGPNYMYLNSTSFGTITNNLLPEGSSDISGNRGPQVAKIPVTVGPGSIIFYEDPAPEYWFSTGFIDTLQEIDFFLTLGNFKEKIDLNGLSFSIKFGVLKKKVSVDTVNAGPSGFGGGNNPFKRSRAQ